MQHALITSTDRFTWHNATKFTHNFIGGPHFLQGRGSWPLTTPYSFMPHYVTFFYLFYFILYYLFSIFNHKKD